MKTVLTFSLVTSFLMCLVCPVQAEPIHVTSLQCEVTKNYPPCPSVKPLEFGLRQFYENGKCGYKDASGNVRIPAKFDRCLDNFHNGVAKVCMVAGKDKWGSKQYKCGFIGPDGVFVVEPKYERVFDFSEGLAAVQQGKLIGYIDRKGEMVIEPRFNRAWEFQDGLALVTYDYNIGSPKKGFIDTKGNIVLKVEAYNVRPFSDGLAMVQKGHKCGYINKKGDLVIPAKFKRANDFYNGLAPVTLENPGQPDTLGYINKSGEFVIVFEPSSNVNSISSFDGELARITFDCVDVEENGKKFRRCTSGCMNRSGQIVGNCISSSIYH